MPPEKLLHENGSLSKDEGHAGYLLKKKCNQNCIVYSIAAFHGFLLIFMDFSLPEVSSPYQGMKAYGRFRVPSL